MVAIDGVEQIDSFGVGLLVDQNRLTWFETDSWFVAQPEHVRDAKCGALHSVQITNRIAHTSINRLNVQI